MKNASLLGLMLLVSLVSCSDPVQPTLGKTEEALIDSLYLSAAKIYNRQHDSICKAYQDEIWQETVDSIEQVRLSEIANMLDR